MARLASIPCGRRAGDPWGSVAADRGGAASRYQYTGQEHDSTGLYDYHARGYDPVLGRFLSADTLVPSPANPQSLNRYSYVLGNPLKYTDPTGHCVPGENCPGDQPVNPYGIQFTADEGQNWDAGDMSDVLDAADTIAGSVTAVLQRENILAHKTEGTPLQRFSLAKVFKQVMGKITFHRSANSCAPNTCWARTNAGNASSTITVYTSDNINFGTLAGQYTYQNAAHELGHVFDNRAGRRPRNDLNAAQISYTDARGQVIVVAGGGWPNLPYQRTDRGYATAGQSAWQQNPAATPGEDFADMFLGWAYNHFANDAAGAARYNWMSTNMAEWITLASR